MNKRREDDYKYTSITKQNHGICVRQLYHTKASSRMHFLSRDRLSSGEDGISKEMRNDKSDQREGATQEGPKRRANGRDAPTRRSITTA